MKTPPDPRQFKPFSSNPLVQLAEKFRMPVSATQHGMFPETLLVAMEAALEAGDAGTIGEALAQAPTADVYRTLHGALGSAIDPARAAGEMQVRLFAIPVLVVTGGSDALEVPGVLTDVQAITQLFALHGALGPMQNFAVGSSLVSAATLAAVGPVELYRRSRGKDGFAAFDLPPADILVAGAEEQLHLRFLAGVSVTSTDAPAFTETSGNIAAWGMPFTRAFAAQLGRPGLSLLAIPRPPLPILAALQSGKFALRELGFQLFLTNALRDNRARTGEPDVSVTACSDASLRIRLRSPLDEALNREYAWPLDPGDDLDAVSASILSLLAECRVENTVIAQAIESPAEPH